MVAGTLTGAGRRRRLLASLACIALVLLVLSGPFSSQAASAPSFVGAETSVQSAFLAVHAAEARGGNVTGLVGRLDQALSLILSADELNSTNPSLASKDLQNATVMAQGVQADAPNVGQQGAAARQLQYEVSIGLAALIVAVAAALYFYGDRLYRRLWLRAYGGYVVRKVG
jgi:hypothetical protein